MRAVTTSRKTRKAAGIIGASALVIGLAGCGGGTEEPPPETTAPPATTAPPMEEPAESEEIVLDVGAEIEYAGFLIRVESARTSRDDTMESADLLVATRLTNLLDVTTAFPADQLSVVWDGGSATAMGGSDQVGAGASEDRVFEFAVDEGFDMDAAVLYAGDASQIRAFVPLADPDGAVSPAPLALEVPDPASDGVIEVVVTAMELRPYGVPGGTTGRPAVQQPADRPLLALRMDLTRLDDSPHDANVLQESFRLVEPDGSRVAPDNFINEIVSSGTTLRDVEVLFELRDVPFDADELPAEEYGQVVSLTWAMGGEAEVEVSFRLVSPGVLSD